MIVTPAHDEGAGHGEVQKRDASNDECKEVSVQHGHIAYEHVRPHGDQLQEQIALYGDGRARRLHTGAQRMSDVWFLGDVQRHDQAVAATVGGLQLSLLGDALLGLTFPMMRNVVMSRNGRQSQRCYNQSCCSGLELGTVNIRYLR
jgi:hypothetical protein